MSITQMLRPVEVKQYSTITKLPHVMIDRVRVESVITLQGEAYHTAMGSRRGSDEWYPVAKPVHDLRKAWEDKAALEKYIREENERMRMKMQKGK